MVDFYIDDLFAREDEALARVQANARKAGLPEIQVSPGQGKLLYLIAKIAGARRVLELGTLAGYSAIWLARALPAEGQLLTLEADPAHAAVARRNFEEAGLAGRIELTLGSAVETLPKVAAAAGEPFDLVFLDADKVNYPFYLTHIMRVVRSGSVILADNVIRAGAVLAPRHDDPSAGAARDFNALVAADERLEAVVLQQVGIKGHDGLLMARVK